MDVNFSFALLSIYQAEEKERQRLDADRREVMVWFGFLSLYVAVSHPRSLANLLLLPSIYLQQEERATVHLQQQQQQQQQEQLKQQRDREEQERAKLQVMHYVKQSHPLSDYISYLPLTS